MGKQNKTREERRKNEKKKKKNEETGRNKTKQAKGVMGLML
jgi:hypothetical protein